MRGRAGSVGASRSAHGGVGVAGDTFDYRIIDHVVSPRLGKGTLYRSFDKLLPIPAYVHASFAQWHQLSWLKSAQTLRELRAARGERRGAGRMLEDLITLIEHDLGFELYHAVGGLKAELSGKTEARFVFSRCRHRNRRRRHARELRELDRRGSRQDRRRHGCHDCRSGPSRGRYRRSVPHRRDIIRAGGAALFLDRFDEARIHVGDAFQSVASGLALIAADRAAGRSAARPREPVSRA